MTKTHLRSFSLITRLTSGQQHQDILHTALPESQRKYNNWYDCFESAQVASTNVRKYTHSRTYLTSAECTMAPAHDDSESDYSAGIIDLSDNAQVTSASEEEPSQREINDRRVTQAINYLNEEGGNDSPIKYTNRLARIDDELIQRLPQQQGGFDRALYESLRAMVREEVKTFQDAAREALTTEITTSESEEDEIEEQS